MNKQNEVWEVADDIIENIDFIFNAYKEDVPIYNIVKDESIEGFIGQSVLETTNGSPGHTMRDENGETIFVQLFSDDKKIYTYLKDGKVSRYEFLVLDKKIDTPTKKLEYIKKKIEELIAIQPELVSEDK
ncbi:hypothetical protein IGI37_002288 [Enterococcus sp. AZ194]|uniref:hypothetical protein n=1 Tax=Enterococcus sp. AZ194 TaxID=2774629 RepID=UPI003F22927B